MSNIEEEEVEATVEGFIHWPEIVGLHVVRKNLEREGSNPPEGLLTYKGKIKLHGVNGGVNICMSFFLSFYSLSFFLYFVSFIHCFYYSIRANVSLFVHFVSFVIIGVVND